MKSILKPIILFFFVTLFLVVLIFESANACVEETAKQEYIQAEIVELRRV